MREPTSLRRNALAIGTVLISACTTHSRIRTFVAPSLAASGVKTVAILPLRSSRLAPDESEQLNQSFEHAFRARNPDVTVLGPAESARALNEAGLTERYSEFVRNYATSGIPDARALRAIADGLHVDGIIQGEIVDVQQRDGEYLGNGASKDARTTTTLKYGLVAARDATVLWESTATGIRTTLTPISRTPGVFEAVSVAQERILAELPKLGGR